MQADGRSLDKRKISYRSNAGDKVRKYDTHQKAEIRRGVQMKNESLLAVGHHVLKWPDFKNLMFWYRRRDLVLNKIPFEDYTSELWILWQKVKKLPFDSRKRANQMGYMCMVSRRVLRDIALKKYQIVSQSNYFYKKDGFLKKISLNSNIFGMY
jgi:hypothetical protein